MQDTTMTINLPPRLAEQVQTFVQNGWVSDLNTLMVEALRRYLESHQMELMEDYIWQDVEWGLHGDD